MYAYLTWVVDPAAPLAWTLVEFGYGGQTTQRPGQRDAQHRACQPWADVIAEGPIVLVEGAWAGTVDAAGRWSSPDLDAVEQAVIGGRWDEVLRLCDRLPGVRVDLDAVLRVSAAGRPRYNVEHNRDNPLQVPSWVALAQRHARDDARGVARWRPVRIPVQRGSVRRPVPVGLSWSGRQAVRRWWARRWPWLAGWAAASGVVAVLAGSQVPGVAVGDAAGLGVLAGSAGCLWLRSRLGRRQRRRRRR